MKYDNFYVLMTDLYNSTQNMVAKVWQLLMLQEKILWNKHTVMEENASANESAENLLVMIIKTKK